MSRGYSHEIHILRCGCSDVCGKLWFFTSYTWLFQAKGTDHPALMSHSVITAEPHWIHQPPEQLVSTGSAQLQFRYQHAYQPEPCVVQRIEKLESVTTGAKFQHDFSGASLHIVLEKPHRALARGQYAVLYQGEECLGSAKILSAAPSLYDLQQQQKEKESACLSTCTKNIRR